MNESKTLHRIRVLFVILLVTSCAAASTAMAADGSPRAALAPETAATRSTNPQEFADLLPVEEFSPAVLGIYRKVMEIEDEIRGYAERYGVDFELARAVCMYESGGNANLTSWAGARGYFQVMPTTFRSLRVDTNIEAGVKYLAQLVDRFEREDYALAAYNGGPTNVSRGRAMRLESLQYVLGVGAFRTALKMHEPSLRHHAAQLRITTVREDEDWWDLSMRTGLTLLQLRLHNPYLAHRPLRPGYVVVYPARARDDLLEVVDGGLRYRVRLGDNYFNIAFTFEIDLDVLREQNELWHLQSLPNGMWLSLPLAWDGDYTVHEVVPGDSIAQIAERHELEPWRIVRDNGLLWDQSVTTGMLLRVRKVPPKPEYIVHRVSRGETLTAIARRYGTSIPTIQRANGMERRTMIRIGESLRIPAAAE